MKLLFIGETGQSRLQEFTKACRDFSKFVRTITRSSKRVKVLMLRRLLPASCLLLSLPVRADVVLVEGEDVDLGSDARGTLFVDVNGDGRPDIVSLSDTVDSLNVLINIGPQDDDRINFSDRRVFRTGGDPEDIAAGDFNADGHIDLAVTDFEDDDVLVFSGDGAGQFTQTATLSTGTEPTRIASADLNGDGRDDLAVIESDAERFAIFLATATGFSARSAKNTIGNPALLVTGDIDADGDVDLVIGGEDVHVVRNDGSGGMSIAQELVIEGDVDDALLVDVDGDQALDLILAGEIEDGIRLIFNDGSATPYTDNDPEDSAYVDTLSLPGSPDRIAAADISGDGNTDLLATAQGSSELAVFEGTGYGKFMDAAPYASDGLSALDALGIGDADGDGRLDVLVVSANDGNAHIFRGLNELHYDSFTSFALGVTPVDVAHARLDFDEYDDAVVRDSSQSLIYLLRSDGEGELVLFGTLGLNAPAAQLAIADIDADGLDDLLVNENGSTAVDVYSSLGSGTFVYEGSVDTGARIGTFTVGEFDGASGADIAISNVADNEISLHAGAGDFTWTPWAELALGERPVLVTAGDLEGDGVDELLVTSGTTETSIRIYATTGMAITELLSVDVASDTGAITLEDLDGDGDRDIAGISESRSVFYALGYQDGGIDPFPSEYPVERGPVDFLLDDVDGDGDRDVVVISAYAKRIGVLYRDGEAYQTHGNYLEASSSPANGTLADINADGRAEVLISLPAEGKIGVIAESENEAPTASDMNLSMDDEDDVLEDFLDGDDVNDDSLRYAIVEQPQHGSVELLDPVRGYFRYTVGDSFDELDSFTYRVDDGALASGVAIVSINRPEDDSGGGALSLAWLLAMLSAGLARRRRVEDAA